MYNSISPYSCITDNLLVRVCAGHEVMHNESSPSKRVAKVFLTISRKLVNFLLSLNHTSSLTLEPHCLIVFSTTCECCEMGIEAWTNFPLFQPSTILTTTLNQSARQAQHASQRK